MLSQEVQAYLKGRSITSVFYSSMPDTPANASVVMEAPGIMSFPAEQAGIQIIVRDSVKATGYNRAKAIFNLLQGKSGFLTTGVSFCRASSSILDLGVDDKGRWLFSMNFLLSVKSVG